MKATRPFTSFLARARRSAILTLLLIAAADLSASGRDSATISILTRNQFLGADLTPIARASDVPSFLSATRTALLTIASNNFPERARALAREVRDRQPDIVALQEVFDFRLNGQHGSPPFVDHLAETLDALHELGARYLVVASVQNFNVTLPADLDGDGVPESLVSATDRDVILVKEELLEAGGIATTPLSDVCARPSQDGGPGCNFVTVATIPTPLGPIPFERGYVAVDATIRGKPYRIVNTHLEVENLDPSNPLSPLIQSAQAAELKALLDAVTPAGLALIIAGDLNSTPVDTPFPDPVAGPFVRPFQQFAEGVGLFGQPAGGAYLDVWDLRPGEPVGNTCCEAENLRSPTFTLSERKDIIFTRERPSNVKANVVGNEPADKTPSRLWPSDHAGVFVRLWF